MSGGLTYQWSYARPEPVRHTTSRTEVWQITLAFIVLTFDLVLILTGFGAIYGDNLRTLAGNATAGILVLAVTAAVTGFFAHELAHKFVAQRLGYWAEFRLSWFGLLFSLVVAFSTGFLFAAPGATMVGGMDYSNRSGWGRTALAGPALNATFAVVFFLAAIATFRSGTFLTAALLFLAFINSWFGLFNLIPLGPLDGAKVLRWNLGYWIATFLSMIALTGITLLSFSAGTPFLLGR
jgi:Zn-dependent protease